MNASDAPSTRDTADHRVSPPVLDHLLSKYVGVWLWSILFGTTTGLMFSFLPFDTDRWNQLIGTAIGIPIALSLVMLFLSWFQLYAALRHCLIPQFFFSAAFEQRESARLGYCLQSAFLYFIVAAILRALASMLEMLLVTSRLF